MTILLHHCQDNNIQCVWSDTTNTVRLARRLKHVLIWNRCFEIELSQGCEILGLSAPSFHNDTPSDGMVRNLPQWLGLCSLCVSAMGQPLEASLFCLLCLSVTLILSGSEAHFIVSVSCEPVVCLHSLSPLCQALTDKASTGANLPPSAPLAVPGLHSTTN